MARIKTILPENKSFHYYGKFYKFLNASSALKTLKFNKIRYSNPTIFNDPLDCSKFLFHLNQNINQSKLFRSKTGEERKLLNKFIEDRYGQLFIESMDVLYDLEELKNGMTDELRNMISQRINQEFFAREELEKYRVTCFSKSYFSKKSILMWTHYADSHKGICIEFNNKKILKVNSLINFTPVVVKYKNEFPRIRTKSEFETNNWLWIKSNQFSYEKEVSLLKVKNTKGRASHLKFPKESLSKIVFGVNTSIETIKEVRDILFENYDISDISFEKMRINNKSLKLIRAKYDIEHLVSYKN